MSVYRPPDPSRVGVARRSIPEHPLKNSRVSPGLAPATAVLPVPNGKRARTLRTRSAASASAAKEEGGSHELANDLGKDDRVARSARRSPHAGNGRYFRGRSLPAGAARCREEGQGHPRRAPPAHVRGLVDHGSRSRPVRLPRADLRPRSFHGRLRWRPRPEPAGTPAGRQADLARDLSRLRLWGRLRRAAGHARLHGVLKANGAPCSLPISNRYVDTALPETQSS